MSWPPPRGRVPATYFPARIVNVLFGAILFSLPVGLLTYRGVQLCRAGDSFRGMAALVLVLGGGLLYLLWLDSSLAYYRASQPLQP